MAFILFEWLNEPRTTKKQQQILNYFGIFYSH